MILALSDVYRIVMFDQMYMFFRQNPLLGHFNLFFGVHTK